MNVRTEIKLYLAIGAKDSYRLQHCAKRCPFKFPIGAKADASRAKYNDRCYQAPNCGGSHDTSQGQGAAGASCTITPNMCGKKVPCPN